MRPPESAQRAISFAGRSVSVKAFRAWVAVCLALLLGDHLGFVELHSVWRKNNDGIPAFSIDHLHEIVALIGALGVALSSWPRRKNG